MVSTPAWREVPIPSTREPLVNAPLVPLLTAAGEPPRYWISSWNSHQGSLGVAVGLDGQARFYRFDRPKHPGFYSAASDTPDTLWLAGNLSTMVRLDLPSGEYRSYPTGAPYALVFQGMILDRPTRKLFAAAFPQSVGTTGVSFSMDAGETSRLHGDLSPDYYARCSFPNGDGSWTMVMVCPGVSLVRWSPGDETVSCRRLREKVDIHGDGGWYSQVITDARGRAYLPGCGWYDPLADTIAAGPTPSREMMWLARVDQTVYGCHLQQDAAHVMAWDLATGSVTPTVSIPDGLVRGMTVTAERRLVSVSMYGVFARHDLQTGQLELTRRLPAAGIQHVDCVHRLDDNRLLGTPFITQRFWLADLDTGAGFDAGRAAPGGGEILRTWRLGDRFYMASYGSGSLMEFDPAEHPHYPENPRVVAKPPHSMRPVAHADDGRHLFYACSRPYGTLGSTVTRYDTTTGEYQWAEDPLGNQQIVGLAYDPAHRQLIASTTYHADCRACPPTDDRCWFATLDAATLAVRQRLPAPTGVERCVVLGPLGADAWLGLLLGAETRFVRLEAGAATLTLGEPWPVPDRTEGYGYAGRPGWYLLHRANRIELWNLAERRQERVLLDPAAGNMKTADGDVFLAGEKSIRYLLNLPALLE